MNPLDKDHKELTDKEVEEQELADEQDRDEPTVASERSRWLDGVDNGNRDYI